MFADECRRSKPVRWGVLLVCCAAHVEGDATVESLIELNFGASEAEAAGLLWDLEGLPTARCCRY